MKINRSLWAILSKSHICIPLLEDIPGQSAEARRI